MIGSWAVVFPDLARAAHRHDRAQATAFQTTPAATEPANAMPR